MDQVLEGVDFLKCYIDDIIVDSYNTSSSWGVIQEAPQSQYDDQS
jgi:hypothetical protein